MKLIFIGTSDGVPQSKRRCSSYLIEVGADRYIIDMGTQTIEDLCRRGIPVESVRLVACTHPHGDHTNGVISFVDLVNWHFKEADPLVLLPDERLLSSLRSWISATYCGKPLRDDLRLEVFSEGTIFSDGHLSVRAIPTKHCENSFAFLVEAEGKKILFTGDLLHPSVDFPEVAFEEELELIVTELGHFQPEECADAFEKARAKRIIFSHISERRLKNASLSTLASCGVRPEIAYDGLELIL